MNSKAKSNGCVCEKSMKMEFNIIKLSSFSIAKMSLGAAGPAVVARNIAHAMDANGSLLPQIHRSQKPQQLRGRSKPFSFVMQPDEGKSSSSCMIHGEKSVIDGMASAYIRKFHEKNIYDAHLH